MKEQRLTAKKLRTGEIAVWDGEDKAVILVNPDVKEGTGVVRVLKGDTLKALEEALGDVVALV